MKLSALTAQYVAQKQSMGMRFHTEARTLRSFCRAMGDIAIAEIEADRVQDYIAGTGPVTRFWHRKHEVLRGFYRFAIARGYAASSPLPKIIPKPPHFVPHIYSQEELQRLLDATACCENSRSKLRPYTFRMLILLLYAAGLRISEALSLRLTDVDLSAGVLTIRESKFYKTRLVPMSLGGVCSATCQGSPHCVGRIVVPDPRRNSSGTPYRGKHFQPVACPRRRAPP
jgi:site-specific recombinase XerD